MGACQRGAAGKPAATAAVNTESITWQRGLYRPSQMTETVHILVIFAKSPSSQSGQVKTLTCRACLLSTWLLFFFFPSQWLCLWPLVPHQAWMKRSFLQLSSQTAMILLQGRQKIASAFWSGGCNEVERKASTEVTGCSPEYLFVLGDSGAMLRL